MIPSRILAALILLTNLAASDGGAPTFKATSVIVANVVVVDYGREVYRGPVDIGPTLDRIAAGQHFPHRDDGIVFQNRESLLPPKPRGYYHEYVHPTPGLRGPGPQRVILGADGDIFYTADHYRSFVAVAIAPATRPTRRSRDPRPDSRSE